MVEDEVLPYRSFFAHKDTHTFCSFGHSASMQLNNVVTIATLGWKLRWG